MKCFNCGFNINDNEALFCPSCGKRLTAISEGDRQQAPSETNNDDMVNRIQNALDGIVAYDDSMRQEHGVKQTSAFPIRNPVPERGAPVPPPVRNPMPQRGAPVPPYVREPMSQRGAPMPPSVREPMPGRGAPVPPPVRESVPQRSAPVPPPVREPVPQRDALMRAYGRVPEINTDIPVYQQDSPADYISEYNNISSEIQKTDKKKKPQQIRYGIGISDEREEPASEGNMKSALTALGVGVGIAAVLTAVIAVPVVLFIIF